MNVAYARGIRSRRPVFILVALLLALATTAFVSLDPPGAQGAVVYQSSSTNMTNAPSGNASTSLTIARPAGLAVGDLLLAQIAYEKGSKAVNTSNLTPAGWVRELRTNLGTDFGQAIYRRIATAEDLSTPSYTFQFHESVKAAGAISRYSGVDQTNPIVGANGSAGSSGPLVAPEVSGVPGARVVALFALKKKESTLVPGSGMTVRHEFENPQDVHIMAAEDNAAMTAPGMTGTRTATATPASDKWVAQLVTLRPPANSAPTVGSIAGPSVVPEAGNSGYSVAASDPDTDTLTYAWTVQSGNASIVGSANAAAVNVSFGDGPGPVALRAVVDDGHGHAVQRDLSVTVNNVAPTATFQAGSPVAEGSPISLSLTAASDPSTADTSAGFTYAFDCGSDFGGFGTASTATCPTTDNGSRTVAGRIRDKDGGVTTYTASVTITNAAPTATFGNDGPVAEGSAFSLSLTGASDPSSADTVAGFRYAFDCGDGYGENQAAQSTSCSTTDNGTRNVRARVIDKDGGFSEYSGTVGVDNVNPTATFSATSPVNEGDDIDLSLTGPSDPSGDDTAAGFDYAFDCDTSDVDAIVDNGSDPTESCATDNNGSRGVAGRVSDKDAGSTTYSADVTIDNVAPTGTFTPVSSVDEGSSFDLALADVTDPSSVDAASLEFAFDCGDGSGLGAFGANSATCTTDDDGSRTVGVTVRDQDGGTNTYTASVTVNSVAPTADLEINPAGDVDEGSDFTLSLVDAFDPSSVDLAGLTYQFDCGDDAGLQAAGTQNSMTCPTDDNDTRDVVAWVIDPDGDKTSYDASVTVVNVSPEPTLAAPATVSEGSDIHLEASDVQDVSSVDEAAGFSFAFDCGSGFGPYGSIDSVDCPTMDNELRSVAVLARDKDGGVGQANATVEVVNIAPKATFETTDVNEGGTISLALTSVTDPSPVETFTYAFHCGAAPFDEFTEDDFSSSSSASCPTRDSGVRTVTGAVRDDDGGVTTYSADVTVHNLAPTGTFTTGDVNEGSPISLSITDVTDPSEADTDAGFEYAFDCGTGSGYGDWGASHTATCPTVDQGSRTVKGQVRDKDGGESEASRTVTINSVAPTGTFTAPASVLEGDDIDLAITEVTDPSPADTAAGFTFAFVCGDGFGVFSGTASRTCSTDDDGDRVVGGKVQDKDEHASPFGAVVQVDNVAPKGTFGAPASTNEGSVFTLSLTDVTDPSSVDTASGFQYAFDCGAGYGVFGSAASQSCPTTDNGARTVGVKVRDKDGGEREYTATTTVLNVAPAVVAPADRSTLPGISTSFALGLFSDPGVDDDPWTVDVSWGDGETGSFTTSTQGAIGNRSHTYALAGSYTVTVRVTDKDLDSAETTFTVEVHLTDKVLLGNEDVEISGAGSQIQGNVHANRDVKISGSGGDICGDLSAGRSVVKMGTQSCGTTTAPAPIVAVPTMANYVPATATHTLTGDRVLNGYTCTLPGGCVVKVTGKLEIRGVITGKVWFLVDKDVVIKGDLAPANAASKLSIYSKLTIDAPASKASISGQFLAAAGLKLSGSTQMLTGLFWGNQYVDMSGSNGSLRGAVISNGLIKLAGSSRTVTYDPSVIKL